MTTGETEREVASDQPEEDSRTLFIKFVKEFSEEELAIILIAAGVVMLVVPPFQPIGIPSILLGVAVWFTDWLWG